MSESALPLDYERRQFSGPRFEQLGDRVILTFPPMRRWVAFVVIGIMWMPPIMWIGTIYATVEFNQMMSRYMAPGVIALRIPISFYIVAVYFLLEAMYVTISYPRRVRQSEVWQASNGRLIIDRHQWGKLRRHEYMASDIRAIRVQVVSDVFRGPDTARLRIYFKSSQPMLRKIGCKLRDVEFAASISAGFCEALNLPKDEI